MLSKKIIFRERINGKKNDKTEIYDKGEIILYRSPDGKAVLDVRLVQETVWLNQRQMAELFDKDTDTIGLHVRNIYKEGELARKGTTEQSSLVQNEGGRQVRRRVNFTILILSYRLVTGSSPGAAPNLESGPPMCCGST